MDREALQIFLNKRIKILLENRITYTGTIKEIYSTSLIFLDKFGVEIAIPFERIERVMETNDNTYRKSFK